MENKISTISVIIPHLIMGNPDREAGLDRCIKSVQNQDHPKSHIEILVVAGEDTVPKKIAQGMKDSTGEYIVYAANDMEFAPDAFRLALEDSKREDRALIAFNGGELLPDEGNICEHFMIRRDFAEKLGEIFDTRFYHVGVDNLLWAKAKKQGQAFRSELAKLTHYHFSKGAMFDAVYAKAWDSGRVDHDRALLAEALKELEAGE